MSANKRVDLLNAAKACDVDKLADIIGKKKSDYDELAEAFAEFSKSQMEEFWQSIYGLCTSTLLTEQDEGQSDEVDNSIRSLLQCVSQLALSTLAALNSCKSSEEGAPVVEIPQSLQEVSLVLHGVFPTLDDKWPALKNQLCLLFEHWWIQRLAGKEDMVVNTITYLLKRCTEPNSTQSDISRLWAVHSMIEIVDFTSDRSDSLVSLLRQSCYHPQFVSNVQGTKFLAFILSLNPDLTETLHQTVKNHLPSTPKSWHSKYGEMYLRAWQKASDGKRQKLEEGCIQDLMYRAVHACRGGTHSFSTVLFRLLSHIHKQKTQRGVELMLSRLYEPILWRSLRVANSDVRLNAAALMFDVFPLQDPTLLKEQADALLQRQFDIMHSLMMDPVPEVRVRAVLGVGNILNLYWELIPSQVIQCFVTTLMQDLVHDVSSPSVREAVLKVMFLLCDNHLCLPLLKKILPELQDFVHDTSEKVRIAMFDLLLKVKGIRGIKFWSIVPVEHILARLESDSPPIMRRVMKLIQSSFVPLNLPPSQQVELCLTLITTNRNAARQFFLNLPTSLGAVDTSRYILVLCRYALESARHLLKAGSARLQTEDKNKDEDDSDETTVVKKSKVKRPHGKRRGGYGVSRDGSDDNIDNADTVDGFIETDSDSQESVTEKTRLDDSPSAGDSEFTSDIDLLSGLMEAVYLMFTVISPMINSPEQAALKEGLAKKLSITVRELLSMSQNDLLDNALIALAGHLPCKAVPMVSQKLMKRLRQSNLDADQRALAIKTLIQWGRANDLIEMMQEVLLDKFQDHIGGANQNTQYAGTNKKKLVAFAAEKSELSFDGVIDIVVTMLSLAESRQILKRKHRDSLRSLVDGLKNIFAYLRSRLSIVVSEGEEAEETAAAQKAKWDNALKAFSVYLRVSAFLSMTSMGDSTNQDGVYMKAAMSLTVAVAIPCLESSPEEETRTRASQVVEKVIKATGGLLMVGCYNPESLNQAMEMCNSVLKSPAAVSPSLLQSALSLVYQFTQLRMGSGAAKEPAGRSQEEPLPTKSDKEEVALTCLTKALQSVSLLDCPKDKEKDRVVVATPDNCAIVAEIVQALTAPRADPEVRDKTLSITADTLVKHLKSCSKQETIGSNGEKLPPFVTSLILAVKRKAANRSSLIRELISHLNSDSVDIHSIHGIASVVPKLRLKDRRDSSDFALEETVQKALSQLTAGGMDEDVFRDLKLQVETEMKAWTRTETQTPG